jgi:hypothetical protein
MSTTRLACSASFPIVSSLPGEEEDNDTSMTPSSAASVPDNHNQQPKRQRQSHLILHFDINETILVGDDAGGDSREDSLHKILAKSAFVQKPVTTSSSHHEDWEPTHWWNGEPIRDHAQDYDLSMDKSNIPPLYTGWHWPTGCCPYYRTRFKSRSKTFVQHHGALYKDIYDEMNRRLQPPAATTKTTTKDSDPAILTSYPILSHMLPAFFETVATLSKQKAAHDLPYKYTIVFRTMGTDLPEIADAVTAFARGHHPAYPDFKDPDLVLTRDKLVQGRWVKVALPDDDNDNDSGNDGHDQYVFQLWQEERLVASGDAQVLEFLHSQTVCGIQDDYTFWKSQEYAPWSGKPTWIPKADRGNNDNDIDGDGDCNYHHVLMDDNIHNLPNDSIASVRVERQDGTFHTLNGPEIQEQQGRSLIRVPTVEPILNPQWFLEQIEKAQRNVAAVQRDEGSLW